MFCSRRAFLRMGPTGLLATGLATRVSGFDQLLAKRLPLKMEQLIGTLTRKVKSAQ